MPHAGVSAATLSVLDKIRPPSPPPPSEPPEAQAPSEALHPKVQQQQPSPPPPQPAVPTAASYLANMINGARVRRGAALVAEHAAVLREVSRRFGVQPQVVVAIWGIETSFGDLRGDYDAAEALARLAFTEEVR